MRTTVSKALVTSIVLLVTVISGCNSKMYNDDTAGNNPDSLYNLNQGDIDDSINMMNNNSNQMKRDSAMNIKSDSI